MQSDTTMKQRIPRKLKKRIQRAINADPHAYMAYRKRQIDAFTRKFFGRPIKSIAHSVKDGECAPNLLFCGIWTPEFCERNGIPGDNLIQS